MNSKYGIMFSVIVLGIMMLLVPSSSLLANAQEGDQYYGDGYYYQPNNNDKKEEREPPMLLVNKEVLFCDSIASGDNFCDRDENQPHEFPKADSGRYIECTNNGWENICEKINSESFNIVVTDEIEFPGSEDEGTKLNFNGERYTVIEEKNNVIPDGEFSNFLSQCKVAGFDDVTSQSIGDGLFVLICILSEGECSGFIQDSRLKECTVKNYIVDVIQQQQEDIVSANPGSDEISVFLGDGTGSFSTSTQFTVGGINPQPVSVTIGHFNADTNLDIVTANGLNNEISVFLGHGTGSFSTSTEFTVGGTDPVPQSVAVGHFNADTNLDIVTANLFSSEISVFLGNGDGTFATSTEFTVGGIEPFSVAVGYFNADTNLDIVTANRISNEISVFLGDGTGSFSTSTEFTVGGTNPVPISVAIGHFNADTNLDIVTANLNSNEISVFLGDGTGSFATSTEFTVGGTNPFPVSVAIGHFNADTNLDIVTANSNSNEISVFLGDGTGSFATSTEFTVGGTDPEPVSVAVGNFNADTNLDIVTANLNSNEISVFLGDGTGSFSTSTEFTVGGTNPQPVSVAVGNFN